MPSMFLHEQAAEILRDLSTPALRGWELQENTPKRLIWRRGEEDYFSRVIGEDTKGCTAIESKGWSFKLSGFGPGMPGIGIAPCFRVADTWQREELRYQPSRTNYFPAINSAFKTVVCLLAAKGGHNDTSRMEFARADGEKRELSADLADFDSGTPGTAQFAELAKTFMLTSGRKSLFLRNPATQPRLTFQELEMTAGFLAPWKAEIDAIFAKSSLRGEYFAQFPLPEETLAFPESITGLQIAPQIRTVLIVDSLS